MQNTRTYTRAVIEEASIATVQRSQSMEDLPHADTGQVHREAECRHRSSIMTFLPSALVQHHPPEFEKVSPSAEWMFPA